jgi:hypothetical protein
MIVAVSIHKIITTHEESIYDVSPKGSQETVVLISKPD